MPASYGKFAHIDAMAVRISRLDATGAIVAGNATGAYLFCCEGRITSTPNVEAGAAVSKGGFCAGKVANTWETPDRISSYAGEITVANMADEYLEIIGAAEALSASRANGGVAAVQVVGSLFYEIGTCADAGEQPGVTIEAWSRPVLCKAQSLGGNPLTTPMWRKKVVPWAYNFVQTAAQDATGDNFPDYVHSFKMRPAGPAWLNGPFNTDGDLSTATNVNAPAQLWTFAEYWTTEAPPTCAAGQANYIATPAHA